MKSYKVKAVVSDLDGTLTNSGKHVTPYTVDVIHEALESGCKLILASGRPHEGVLRVIDELELKKYGGYVISYNGCLVTEIKSGKVLFEKKIPQELALSIYQFVKTIKNVDIATYQPGYIYSERADDKYLQIEAFGCSIPITVTPYLPDIMRQGIHKYVITGEPEVIPSVRKLIEEKFGNQIDTIVSEPFFLEIVPTGINKAATLDYLLKILQIDRKDIAAFGDGENDVEMLKYAGTSFAMKNGCDTVKRIATYTTSETNDEDGVGRAIEEYLMI